MKRFLPFLFIFLLASVISAQSDDSSVCPNISVQGPAGVIRTGETASYSVQIDIKGLHLDPQYVWSVSAGQILNGQGTTSIDVRQPDEALTVSVEVKGLPENCAIIASETIITDPRPQAMKVLEMPGGSPEAKHNDLDQLVDSLNNQPNTQLFILIGQPHHSCPVVIDSNERQITDYLLQHGINKERITIKYVNANVELMQFWLAPPGAENPRYDNCERITETSVQNCPTISIGPAAERLSPGGAAIFTVNLDNTDGRKLTYQWTISAGEVESGQGTQSISIHIPTEARATTAVTSVRVNGLAEGCPNTASTKFVIVCGACDPLHFDEYGDIRFADEKARLDRFAKEVLSSDKTTGYIIGSFPKRISLAMRQRKIREMKQFLFVVRKYPKERFVVLLGASGRASTKLYIVPDDPITNKPADINK